MKIKYFYKREYQDHTEQKSKIKDVTIFDMLKNIVFTILQGLVIFYTQHLLFYKNRDEHELPSQMFLALVIFSSTVTMSFSISPLNKSQEMKTMIGTAVVFVVINIYFTAFQTKSDEFYKYSVLVKLLYTVIFAPLVLFLQVTSFLWQVFVTKYCIKCKMTANEDDYLKFYHQMEEHESNAGLMGVLDCYLRAAPQMVAQFTMIFHDHGNIEYISVPQMCSILVAFIMMPWSITSFRNVLLKQENQKMKWNASTVYFNWHFFIMVSRILAIAGTMAFWPLMTSLGIIIHWSTSTFWLCYETDSTEFRPNNKCWHSLVCLVFGIVYIFFPMNLVNKPTRYKYISFYSAILAENLLASIAFIVEEKEMNETSKICFVIFTHSTYFIGICFMVLNYKIFNSHQNKPNEFDDEDVI